MRGDCSRWARKFNSEHDYVIFCEMVEEKGYPIEAERLRALSPLEGPKLKIGPYEWEPAHKEWCDRYFDNGENELALYKEDYRRRQDMTEGPVSRPF